jgi:hypothetical protein
MNAVQTPMPALRSLEVRKFHYCVNARLRSSRLDIDIMAKIVQGLIYSHLVVCGLQLRGKEIVGSLRSQILRGYWPGRSHLFLEVRSCRWPAR